MKRHGRTDLPQVRGSEAWLFKLTGLRPLILMHAVLALRLREARELGLSDARQSSAYVDALVPLLGFAAVARAPLGILSICCFVASFVWAMISGPQSQGWTDIAGLVLGWTAALGLATCVVRIAAQRVLRPWITFLMRARLVEPRDGDVLWQAVIAGAAALWVHQQ